LLQIQSWITGPDSDPITLYVPVWQFVYRKKYSKILTNLRGGVWPTLRKRRGRAGWEWAWQWEAWGREAEDPQQPPGCSRCAAVAAAVAQQTSHIVSSPLLTYHNKKRPLKNTVTSDPMKLIGLWMPKVRIEIISI
jgi:hypothetical protein